MKSKTVYGILSLFAIAGLVTTLVVLAEPYKIEEPKTIYVESIVGCVPLEDKYTQAQWEAKQDFTSKYLDQTLVRCD